MQYLNDRQCMGRMHRCDHPSGKLEASLSMQLESCAEQCSCIFSSSFSV